MKYLAKNILSVTLVPVSTRDQTIWPLHFQPKPPVQPLVETLHLFVFLLEPQVLFRLPVFFYCSAVHIKWRAIIRLGGVRDKSDRYYHPKTPFRLNLINSTFITRHRSAVYADRSVGSMSERFVLLLMSLQTDRTVFVFVFVESLRPGNCQGPKSAYFSDLSSVICTSLGWYVIIRWVLTELLEEQTSAGRFSHNPWVIIGFWAWSIF